MKRRIVVALATSALTITMVPSVASAEWPGQRGDNSPDFEALAGCTAKSGGFAFFVSPPLPAGTQGQVRAEAAKECVPGTVQFTKTKVSP